MNSLAELKNLSILFADDDEVFSHTTVKTLEMLFAKVYYAKNGYEALALYDKHVVNMIMLDIRMGDISGIEVAKEIRNKDIKIPIFMVSSYMQTDELIASCALRLVGYLVKPFTYQQLENVLHVCLEELKELGMMRIELDETIVYDPFQKAIFNNEVMFRLTNSEMVVLEFLIQHRGHMVSYIELQNVLGNDSSHTVLKNVILRLRKKIGEKYIQNLSKMGYLLA
jgi:DNA-binding response OmpR family regulator